MASQIKHKIAKNFYEALQSKVNTGNFNDFLGRFNLLNTKTNQVVWKVTVPAQPDSQINVEQLIQKSQQELIEKKTVKKVTLFSAVDRPAVHVELDVKHFIKDVLDSDPTKLNFQSSPKKILVEFSSPNIAKPFHVGHLRSTIIGNCLANVKKKLGNDVVKINYLGDWGVQFGMIQLGMNLENYSEEDLKKNPLKILFKAYVTGNAEAEKNAELYEQARKLFSDLEFGKEEITKLWNCYRNYTKEELDCVYKRLGVLFDEYCWESDYKRQKANSILKQLEEIGVLGVDGMNRRVAIVNEKEIPLLRSDDTTLYLLRDLMALAERRSNHKFDEMYYVVDNGQSTHFTLLKELCSVLKFDEDVLIEHVKFGKIQGMSTRKGKVIFLSDILDEARDIIYGKQEESKNTKISLSDKDVADILGVSAVIVNDLKKRRLRDYEFSWSKSLQLKGETGIGLQYCHCRLCNLDIESGRLPATECDPEALLEPSAINLVSEIARYEEFLHDANANLEPCTLVRYMFGLVKAVNVAYKELNVKYEDEYVARQRLLMFSKSRKVLTEGMRLLGIKPLERM